jgi:hypothetical protein
MGRVMVDDRDRLRLELESERDVADREREWERLDRDFFALELRRREPDDIFSTVNYRNRYCR